MKVQGVILVTVAVVCLFVAPVPARASTIPAGYDLLETDSSTTYQDVSLPSDFFGPGSDPFDGRIYFKGDPFDCFDPDGPGPEPLTCGLLPTDTVVRRLTDVDPPGSVNIQIVELSLKSVSPFVVSFFGGASFQQWELRAKVTTDASTGVVFPSQTPGTMTLTHEYANGGTFESTLPVLPELIFQEVGGPGFLTLVDPALTVTLDATGAPWCHSANPLGFPPGHVVIEAPALNSDFYPSVHCAGTVPPLEPAVSFSVDGGILNPARTGAPLTPAPNPAEGLRQPDPRHPVPNDVYAVGTAPGAQGYATEGEIFQAAGDVLGSPPNQTNVDRMSSALGIGPAPGGPPFMGPFLPNPVGAAPAPTPPGVTGPPGSFGPPPGNTVGVLGLVPDDNIDALSYGRDSGNVLLFSVDPATIGLAGGDVNRQAVTSPFGGAAAIPFPTNPGGGDPGGEAAGDVFKSVSLLSFGSYIPLHFANGQFLTPAWLFPNQLAMDELLLGLQAPALNGSGINPPEDDLDGLELSDTGSLIFGADVVDNATGMTPPDGIPDRHVFFSVDTASPSNGVVAGPFIATPDDILVTPPGGFSFSVYADGVIHVGLMSGDDIDAVAISDVAVLGGLDVGLDEALFSLHPGSPSVRFGPDGVPATGDEVSAADVFFTRFTGTFILYASSATLGLASTDNVNAIDIQPAMLYPQPVPPPPIPPGPPGPIKRLVGEAALLAAHGIRVPEKKPCFHWLGGDVLINHFTLGDLFVHLDGSAEVESGAPAFDPETARSEIQTEMVSMDLIGPSPLGPMQVTAGRLLGLEETTGEIKQITPGIDFPAESFFDVYMRIEIPTVPTILFNYEPVRMEALIDHIPPYGNTYVNAPGPPILLYDEFGTLVGELLEATQTAACVLDTDCDDGDLCTQDACDLATGGCTHMPLPDSDGDGVCDEADNCAQYANAGGQAPLVFGQDIKALSPIEFCWPDPVESLLIEGDLALVGSYVVSNLLPLGAASCFLHVFDPPAGGGFYFLLGLDCPAGSWQSSLGLEPERDQVLP